MKTLSAAMLTEVGATITRPGYLVQLDFATPVRLSTVGDVSWSGYTWTGADVRVDGIGGDASGNQGGRLELGNTDLAYSALVLAEGIADRRIRIWMLYGDATADGDPVAVFDGAGDEALIDADRVRVTLSPSGSRTLYSPRKFGGDFTRVQPVGTRIPFNGEIYELTR